MCGADNLVKAELNCGVDSFLCIYSDSTALKAENVCRMKRNSDKLSCPKKERKHVSYTLRLDGDYGKLVFGMDNKVELDEWTAALTSQIL